MGNSNSKQTLIRLLTFIRDCEAEKPLDEMNMGLIEACVKLLLKLQKKEIVFTTEQIKEMVRKIPFVLTPDFGGKTTKKVKKYTTKKKILLVAAIIALLAMLMGIVYSNSKDDQFFRDITDKIGLDNIEKGKIYTSDGVSYEKNKQSTRFDDIDDYPEDNPYGILLPTYLPNDIESNDIIVVDDKNICEIRVTFNTSSLVYNIYLDSKIPQSTLDCCTETTINNRKIYIIELLDIGTYQMYFEHNGDYYELCYTDKQELLKVIENLEE